MINVSDLFAQNNKQFIRKGGNDSMNKIEKKENGFTIIEVVLVLAIAALIMLLVFLALPALQRGQRDTQRKNDVGRLQAAVQNYKSRNNGRIPGSADTVSWSSFFTNEMRRASDTFADPSGGDYQAQVESGTLTADTGQKEYSSATASHIYIYPGLECRGENAVGTVTAGARKAAIVKPLEGGGRHCQEA